MEELNIHNKYKNEFYFILIDLIPNQISKLIYNEFKESNVFDRISPAFLDENEHGII